MKRRRCTARLLNRALALSAVASVAFPCAADVGLPMVIPSLVFMVPALPVVILIEGYILLRVAGLSFRRGVTSAAFANVISTLVGMPLAWLTFLLLELSLYYTPIDPHTPNTFLRAIIFVCELAWVSPPLEGPDAWRMHFAFLMLLVPYFLTSVWIEHRLVRWSLANDDVNRDDIFRGVLRGNLVTYALLSLIPIGNILYALTQTTSGPHLNP